jgi:hypothetical protein
MSSRHKRRYVRKQDKHVRLYSWLLMSEAWRSLSCEARALLVELSAFYNGENNGALFLSIREAARRLNIGKSSAARAFAELTDRGFIRPLVKGAFSRKVRHATSWVLTEFPIDDGIARGEAMKDFMRWKPPPEKQNTVPLQGQTVPP